MYFLHISDGRIWITDCDSKSKGLNNAWKVGITELSSPEGDGVILSYSFSFQVIRFITGSSLVHEY